jgi:hypothetical protein
MNSCEQIVLVLVLVLVLENLVRAKVRKNASLMRTVSTDKGRAPGTRFPSSTRTSTRVCLPELQPLGARK